MHRNCHNLQMDFIPGVNVHALNFNMLGQLVSEIGGLLSIRPLIFFLIFHLFQMFEIKFINIQL